MTHSYESLHGDISTTISNIYHEFISCYNFSKLLIYLHLGYFLLILAHHLIVYDF